MHRYNDGAGHMLGWVCEATEKGIWVQTQHSPLSADLGMFWKPCETWACKLHAPLLGHWVALNLALESRHDTPLKSSAPRSWLSSFRISFAGTWATFLPNTGPAPNRCGFFTWPWQADQKVWASHWAPHFPNGPSNTTCREGLTLLENAKHIGGGVGCTALTES